MRFSFEKIAIASAFVVASAFCFSESACAADDEIPAGESAQFLAKDGRVFAKIFISADGASDAEVAAAFDLAAWLARVADAETPVPVEVESVNASAETAPGIYVGDTRAAARLGLSAPVGEGETSLIETRGNAVFIVGNTPAATRIAAGDFLREALGIDFVWPGSDGAEWSPRAEIPFPKISKENLPAFQWRLIGVADSDWSAHLGFGALPRFSHNLGRIFTKEIFEENPHLAPTVFDIRRAEFDGGYAPQPNLASPDALPVAVAAAKKYFEKNPDAPMFSLGMNDSTSWDESEESARVFGDLKYFRNLPDRSNYFFDFVNRVADAFRSDPELTDKSVGAIAYLDTQNAPSFLVRENVVPVLCADRSMWVFPEFKADDKALMQRWAQSGVKCWGVYDYYYGTPFLFPRLYLWEEAEAIKFIHANGGKIFYAECGPVVAFDAPKIWLAAELLRDPSGDPEKILDDYYKKTFGAAADAMKKFYDFSCKVWREQGGQIRWIKAWNNENSVEIFPPEKLAEARTFLNEAFAAQRAEQEKNEVPAARIQRISARLQAVDDALSRAEKFARSYFERKALARAKTETLADVLAALRSPAWRYEEIYDDAEFRTLPHSANISAYQISDPRPAAFARILEFLKKTNSADEKAAVARELERVFGVALRARAGVSDEPLPASDARLRVISEAAPFFENTPDTVENFESENFSAYSPGDWRARKNLFVPDGWKQIFASAEKFECAPSEDFPHGGKTSLRIAGNAERAQFSKFYRVRDGSKILAQVFARGKVSCGSVSYVEIEFFGARGNKLGDSFVCSLPVGETRDWTRLVALGEAPVGARTARVTLFVGLQAPGDETFFDDFSASVF